MLNSRHRRRGAVGATLSSLIAGLCAIAVMAAMPAASMADPGNCGVRVQGPVDGGSQGRIAYTIRNKCGTAYSFRVYFPAIGRQTACAKVYGTSWHTFYHAWSDPHWVIKVC